MASEGLNAFRAWARAIEMPTEAVSGEGNGRANLDMAKPNSQLSCVS